MKCDFCPADATRMVGDTNGILACAKCAERFEEERAR